MSLLLEKTILNQCLTVIGANEEVMAILKKPEIFSVPDYQRVYEAVCTLSRAGTEPDVIAVNNYLLQKYGNHSDMSKTGDLQRNWLDILLELTDFSDRVTGALSHHCFLLIEQAMCASMQRVFVSALTQLQLPGADPLKVMDQVGTQLETYQGRLLELKGEPFSKALERVSKEVEEAGIRGDAITGIRTGLHQLDAYLKGLHPATLTILAGRPAMGKTAQLCQMAYNIAYVQQIPTAIFSLEMSNDQLARRFLAMGTHYKNAEILSGLSADRPLDLQRVFAVADQIGQSPLYVRDDVYDLDSLKTEIKRHVRKHGVRVVFIDYLQLIEAKAPNRREMTGKVSRGLKLLSKDLKIPIVALAQLSRDVDKREDKRPVKSDLKESGDLEQDADNIIFQYRDSYYAEAGSFSRENELENIVAKNRNGSTHKQGESILFWLDLPTNRMADREPSAF
ncbi:AAA family ATPase [Rudanella paleaurantiibacter]|uniref:DNA 5'-3' helicase n=1 Tax=Rudanella paleaurantiibacter TaxID=2614655 RepID=A0A7J5TYB4_9BACT|nr:DnaB-like helicase C-terminal domain-containing protein [Rudanella paleaurantiibacter]KAB7730122.1 AAA family ATPase [Rudanella paleaurantiibacter]